MSDLPAPVIGWIEQTTGGGITRLERAVARREAWIVDVTRPDGSVCAGFLRIERSPRDDPSSLDKEVAIVRALRNTSVPVTDLYGSDAELRCALFERLGGRADLPNAPPAQQRAVMEDFIDIVARLHRLDPDELGLAQLPRPETPEQCALADVDLLLRVHAPLLARSFDLLLKYGIDWLRRFVPATVHRVSLLQGDAGPVNFMFDGDRVTAIFDWEWGHFGDPMEDLGNIAVREFWNPSGGLEGLLDRYEAASGIPVDRDTVRYYRVQQQIRGMFGIHAATGQINPREPITWYLAYRYVGDRATCEALGEAMHIRLDPPELPDDDGRPDPLAEAAVWALTKEIAPATTGELATRRVKDVEILINCMDRVARLGAWTDGAELADINELLGTGHDSLERALAAFNERIEDRSLDDAAMLRLLHRRACRREWLYRPCVALYPDRRWSAL